MFGDVNTFESGGRSGCILSADAAARYYREYAAVQRLFRPTQANRSRRLRGRFVFIERRFVDKQAGTNSSTSSSDRILAVATTIAQAHGYGGLNLRALAQEVGIKAASLYHHFPSKADLAAAVARRYWEDAAAALEELSASTPDPADRLRKFPGTFRAALENENRMCLASFMTAENDDLPDVVKKEIQSFVDVNVAWLAKNLVAAEIVASRDAKKRARAIFAAVSGAQLLARGRSDIKLYDTVIDSYRAAGLLPE